MLSITIPDREYYDESKSCFCSVKGRTIQLEHSLISVSRWESIWEKPFLTEEEKTREETLSYIKCMTVTPNVDPDLYANLGAKELREIEDYIHKKMTATTVTRRGPMKSGRKRIMTSEVIYHDMIVFGIPFECEKWHLQRLLTLLDVCAVEDGPQDKMSRRDQLMLQHQLNAARCSKYKTRG